MRGRIFNIQRFCVNDGPGIRTTVFFKGCPLHCVWCHNPESQSFDKELLIRKEKCIGCGRCKGVPTDDADFVCLQGARSLCGKDAESEDILAEILKDKSFYEASGGGMTLSGGEPLAQPDFAISLLCGSKENGIHTAVETCGHVKTENIMRAAEFTDLFLYDIKETDPERHAAFTGADNVLILQNLRTLDRTGAEIILRCPVIPGYNDRDDHFEALSRLAESLRGVKTIEIEPYNPLGEDKYPALGRRAADIPVPSGEQTGIWIEKMRRMTGIPVRKG